MKVITATFYLQEKKQPNNVRCYGEKNVKINVFSLFEEKCKQNLDSYCPDSAGLKYLHFYAF